MPVGRDQSILTCLLHICLLLSVLTKLHSPGHPTTQGGTMPLAAEPSTFVISITPFDQKERFDEEGLRGHFRRLAASGIGVYVAGGGSGEAYTLSKSETKRVLEIGVEELKGKVPVRGMGKEPRSAKELIEFAKMCEAAGVEAMQLYSLDAGHGAMPSRPVLERYLVDVIESVSVPLVI